MSDRVVMMEMSDLSESEFHRFQHSACPEKKLQAAAPIFKNPTAHLRFILLFAKN